MKLSILTLIKDRPGHLAQLVEGLRRSGAVPHEFIVVDMGSDPPVEVGALPFPTRIIRRDRGGLPLAAARNAAARAASGDALLFLDVDCIPMRGLARAMADALARQDALICAQVRYLRPDEARNDWHEAELLSRSTGRPERRFPACGLLEVENAALFWSLVFGIRRERFFALGGFDEAFTGYGAEDTDFGFRARAAGLPLLFMGGPGAFHQYHDSFELPLQHLGDIVRNAQTFRERWNRWPMEGWLAAFREMGVVRWDEHTLSIERLPTRAEMERARVAHNG